MIDNILAIDHAMHINALKDEGFACAIFFDFVNAFPSVLQAYLWKVLLCMGLPECFVQGLMKLYRNNKHIIKLSGWPFDGPTIFIGIKQCCPSSMVLFAIALEPFFRHLELVFSPQMLSVHSRMILVLSCVTLIVKWLHFLASSTCLPP